MMPSHKIRKALICVEMKTEQTHVFGKKVVCNEEKLFVTLGILNMFEELRL